MEHPTSFSFNTQPHAVSSPSFSSSRGIFGFNSRHRQQNVQRRLWMLFLRCVNSLWTSLASLCRPPPLTNSQHVLATMVGLSLLGMAAMLATFFALISSTSSCQQQQQHQQHQRFVSRLASDVSGRNRMNAAAAVDFSSVREQEAGEGGDLLSRWDPRLQRRMRTADLIKEVEQALLLVEQGSAHVRAQFGQLAETVQQAEEKQTPEASGLADLSSSLVDLAARLQSVEKVVEKAHKKTRKVQQQGRKWTKELLDSALRTKQALTQGQQKQQVNSEPEDPSSLPGCIIYTDSRSINASLLGTGYDAFEQNGCNIPGFLSAKFINRAYARRHGYLFLEAAAGDFPKDRHPSWFKVEFIRQKLQCCCKWAFYCDSDAYFRMDNHQLSVEDWILSLGDKGHFDYIPSRFNVSMVNQTWFPFEPKEFLNSSFHHQAAAIIPRNGADGDGFAGWPEDLFRERKDYVNAGIMLWKRTQIALEILERWYAISEDEFFRWKHPWEQPILNERLREYMQNVLLVPFFELTGFNGSYVRHIWSKDTPHRDEILSWGVLGLVSSQDFHGVGCS